MRTLLQRIKTLTFALLSATTFVLVVAPHHVAAGCDPVTDQRVSIGFPGAENKGGEWCVALNSGSSDINQNPIITFLKGIVQFLAAGVGLAVVGGIVYGGIMFMTARANPGQIQKAEEILRSAIIGLLLYIFMFAILNFLIPGGILS